MVDDVARDIAGGEPPQWLVQALEELAQNVAAVGLSEASDPSRAELRSRFTRLQTAAKQMDRALKDIRYGWLWVMSGDVEAICTIGLAQQTAIEVCDRALKRIPAGGGRTRARRLAGPSAREICAIIVLEAWATVREPLHGANNERIGEICMNYWLACGGPPIGKASKGGGPNNWRRSVKRALSDNSALRQYIRNELRRRAVQN